MKKNHIKNRLFKPLIFFVVVNALISSSKLFSFSLEDSNKVKIYNRCDYVIYAGIYKIDSDGAKLISQVKSIQVGLSETFFRSAIQIYTTKKVVISLAENSLKKTLKTRELESLLTINVSLPILSKFFIAYDQGKLSSFNLLSWISRRKQEKIRHNIVSKEKFSSMPAVSREGCDLSIKEQEFVNYRIEKSKLNLENKLSVKLDNKQVPKIALCTSGGGIRAMYATLGLVEGLESIGLLDSITYFSAVSGSSWMLMSWLMSGKPLDQLKKEIISSCSKSVWNLSKDATSAFSEEIKKKVIYDQQISLIDWYGIVIAEKLLKSDDRFKLTMSDMLLKKDLKEYPFPIFNAAFKGEQYYEWLEISPYEAGSDYLKKYIPSWSLGRTFSGKKSENFVPEMKLGYIMGILGSSFAASINDLVSHMLSDDIYSKISMLGNFSAADKKFSPAKVDNFSFMYNQSPIYDKKQLELVDAGYACNIPLPSMLKAEREVDIIIVLDNRLEKHSSCRNLRRFEQIAKRSNLKIPTIDYNKAINTNLSVFKNEGCATIIYMPLRMEPGYSNFDPVNEKFCSTYNFTYTEQQAKLLCGLTKYKITKNKNLLLKIINQSISGKSL